MPTVLHAGCGRAPLPAEFADYDEVRLDIDPGVQPDIVAPLTDMGDIGPFDAIYTSHCLEHLYPHDVGTALNEFRRVLKPGGKAFIIVPDLEGVVATEDPLYDCSAGPVCGLDLIYGMGRLIASNPYMAHRCGFVKQTLESVIDRAGFAHRKVLRDGYFNIVAVAVAP